MTTRQMNDILEDTRRHMAELEVVRIKEALWRVSLWTIRETQGPIDMSVFEGAIRMLSEQMKISEALKANPIYTASVQDAIAEVRSEARQMFCAPKEDET